MVWKTLAAQPLGTNIYDRGGQLAFDWGRLENFFLTRDRPVGNKSQIQNAEAEYRTCKRSVPSFSKWCTDMRQKRLLRLNHDCQGILGKHIKTPSWHLPC